MTAPVTWENRGGIALITIDSPPVNALGQPVRAALLAAVEAAEADPAIRALVIAAAGRSFPAGADIREFGKPPQPPHLPGLLDRIEACKKPVVAALHGTALGGGLELALAAHVRIARADTRLGFPEVSLGLLPGAGGTQRAPRLIGAARTLDMMLHGRPVRAADALAFGLIDGVVEDGLTEAALALADEIAADLARTGKPPVPTRDRTDGFGDPVAYADAIAAARREPHPAALPAPPRIIDCVEAAMLLPFDSGLDFEAAAFEDLLNSPAAIGLRHAFLGERRALKIPEAGAGHRPIAAAAVIGGGRMGSGLAVALLSLGLKVTLVERDHETLITALETVADLHEAAVARGRLTPERRDAEWERLAGADTLERLPEADLVIEAIPEDIGLKADLFRQIGQIARPGTILATATATLDVAALAHQAGRPEDTIVLRVLPPAHLTRLMEVGVLPGTAPDVTATAFELARRLGKLPIRAAAVPGQITGRMMAAQIAAADALLLAGASPAAIDTALRNWGLPEGPFQMQDRIGLDAMAAFRSLAPEAGPPAFGADLAAIGRLGRATGAGWYLWAEGSRRGEEDPEVTAYLQAERSRLGFSARRVGEDEIQHRCLLAMIAEGTRLLADGTALRPSDIDMAMIAGPGFPRWRGGPMLQADMMGLLAVKTALARLAPAAPDFWTPSGLLDDLIKNGRTFGDMNGT